MRRVSVCRVVLDCLVDSGRPGRGWGDSKYARIVSSDRDVQMPCYVVRMARACACARALPMPLKLCCGCAALQRHASSMPCLPSPGRSMQLRNFWTAPLGFSVRVRHWSTCKRTVSHDLAAAARARLRARRAHPLSCVYGFARSAQMRAVACGGCAPIARRPRWRVHQCSLCPMQHGRMAAVWERHMCTHCRASKPRSLSAGRRPRHCAGVVSCGFARQAQTRARRRLVM